MSQLLHGAHSDLGLLMGLTTVLFFSALVGWTWWAFSPANREKLERASRLPLDDGGPS
ncbi:MAG: cbb3-type cytochrome c oxidase subunit 3 [Myxococcota bacterium]